MGVRPNSPPQITSVSSSSPRCLRSLIERGGGLIGGAAVGLEVARDVGVGVPAFVIDVDEPHAALDHPPRQQAGPGERGFVRIGAVHRQGRLALALQVHQLGGGGLQPEGHLVGGDAGGDLGVADGLEPPAVQRADQVERVALEPGVDAGRARDVEDRVALVAEADARVDRSAGTRSTSWPRRR